MMSHDPSARTPSSDGNPDQPRASESRLSRRSFVVAAVSVGGSAGLSACMGTESVPDLPQGPSDLSSLPVRQHAWNDVLKTDAYGNHIQPRHRVLLLLDLRDPGQPGPDARERVETTLRKIERAYPRSPEGLLFTVSYSRAYFDRFEENLPESVDLPEPRALAPFEDPSLDRPDAVLHLASDYGQVVLEAERALMGEQDALNGVPVGDGLSDVFERSDRRTGFVGDGLPKEHEDVDGIPDSTPISEDAPMFMGFESGFKQNQATEDRVTIQSGPFEGGTTQQLSTIRLHLDQWYDQDSRYHREASMFCPHLADEDAIEGTGENLGASSGMARCPAHTDQELAASAQEEGIVGHSQKMVRAREESRPRLLRRDVNSTDGDHAGLHFLSLQREITDFIETREAMNGTDLAADTPVGQRADNGILQYFSVTRRGNYLVPPRDRRALPTPAGD